MGSNLWILVAAMVAVGCGGDKSRAAATGGAAAGAEGSDESAAAEGGAEGAPGPGTDEGAGGDEQADEAPADTEGGESGEGGEAGEGAGRQEGGGQGGDEGEETDPAHVAGPFEVSGWLKATMGGSDRIYESLEKGEWTAPSGEGRDELGVAWQIFNPEEDGTMGQNDGGIVYFVKRFSLDRPLYLVGQMDKVVSVWINGRRLPGDVYGSGRMRIPLLTQAGENTLVVRAIPGNVAIRLTTAAHRVSFNTADQTVGHLREGIRAVLPFGIPLLNHGADALLDLQAEVVDSEHFEASTVGIPALPAGAATQVAFELRPKAAWGAPETVVPVTLRVTSPGLDEPVEQALELTVVAATGSYKQTFVSAVDGSVQYYGVNPPSDLDPERAYSLILSLHGAGVEGIGQARAYGQKDWAYIIAPTNRRPFGFDWEEWGHLNGLAALEHAMAGLRIDPTRVYVTGHSMGGHGTWQFGVHHPGRFAVVAPSAGWASFYSYTGLARPQGVIGRARAQSDSLTFMSNLAQRGVYVIHGDADNNVPVREGRDNTAAARRWSDDVEYHEEPGAGHWWDNDPDTPGAACVDWAPLMEFIQARTLDPYELEFDFKSPYPSYSASHSYVTIRSARSPMDNVKVSSWLGLGDDEGMVFLDTDNVRSMLLDGTALAALGIDTLVIDDEPIDVLEDDLPWGPQDGKRQDLYGPFNQLFHKPHCYVYPDDDPDGRWAGLAAYWISTWQMIGNGHACALPKSAATPERVGDRNLVYVGLGPVQMGDPPIPFAWSADSIGYRAKFYSAAALAFTYPDRRRERLMGGLFAPDGADYLLYRLTPFSSRSGLPDYILLDRGGILSTGFFDSRWRWNAGLAQGEAN
jgi:predicted peptidase